MFRSTAQQDRDDFIAGEEADHLPEMPWDVKMCHWGRVRSAMSFFRKWCAKIQLTSIPFRLKTYRKGQFLDEVDDLFFSRSKREIICAIAN